MQAASQVLESFDALLTEDGRRRPNRRQPLVEEMCYLYLRVMEACNLPPIDLIGIPDPYVRVRLGNYKATTSVIPKNRNPCWRQVFAFSKDMLGSSYLEVAVKDFKHKSKYNNLIGRVDFDTAEIEEIGPILRQWYTLEDEGGNELTDVEIMLDIWFGTQEDEAFSEAWPVLDRPDEAFSEAWPVLDRPRIYISPKLCSLRVHIVEAQDLVLSDKSRGSQTTVRVKLGHQRLRTKTCESQSVNPMWNEELLFVAAEPFNEPLTISVEDSVGLKENDLLGQVAVPFSAAYRHKHTNASVEIDQWYNLCKPTSSNFNSAKRKGSKFFGQIHVRLFLSAGDDLLNDEIHDLNFRPYDHKGVRLFLSAVDDLLNDEFHDSIDLNFRLYDHKGDPLQCENNYSSEHQSLIEHIEKPVVGTLELGILSAQNLLCSKYGQSNYVYCVAKYGSKWVRTRALPDTPAPRWNEQYDWEVFDPCSAITVAVYESGSRRDHRIGKIRIRLSTLETDRTHANYYPLYVLGTSGTRNTGKLQLAVRFTCTDWLKMVAMYGKPLLPKMYYVQPFSAIQLDYLRYQAMKIVSLRLAKDEPAFHREVVEDILGGGSHMWSLRRTNAHMYRIALLLSRAAAVFRWFDRVRKWENPATTIIVHAIFLALANQPEFILVTMFLSLFVLGLRNYQFRPVDPPQLDVSLSYAEHAHPDEVDEEFDTFPTSRPEEIVRMRYDRLRSNMRWVQEVMGELAAEGEGALALVRWTDPRATKVFIVVSLICAVLLYMIPLKVVLMIVGTYLLRHPVFRTDLPSVVRNFFSRLPANSDMVIH